MSARCGKRRASTAFRPGGVCDAGRSPGAKAVVHRFDGSGENPPDPAADRVLNVSMELGGNAPFLVLADADLEAAVVGGDAGQDAQRRGGVYCGESLLCRRRSSMSSPIDLSRHGGDDGWSRYGTGGRSRSTDQRGKPGQGGRAGGGGRRRRHDHHRRPRPDRKGFFYLPTVIKDVAPSAAILEAEIFGPVAPIVRFDDIDHAIEQANDTDMGLISYVYTSDERIGMSVAERLDSGMVALNRGLISDPATPFGGVKQSGLGREGSHHGMAEFLEPKYIGTNG